MSDYVFHPRINTAFMQTYNDIYYRAGVNAFKPSGLRFSYNEWYAFGRFWEIIDSQIQNAAQTIPASLGYIKETDYDPDQVLTDYRENQYWFDANLWSISGWWTLENTDNYQRFTGSAKVGCAAWFMWGSPDTSFSSCIGIVERVQSATSFDISMYDMDYNVFKMYHVQNGRFINAYGYEVTLRGFIENPIYTLYDNIIIGKPIGKKFPIYMMKKVLMKKQGVII